MHVRVIINFIFHVTATRTTTVAMLYLLKTLLKYTFANHSYVSSVRVPCPGYIPLLNFSKAVDIPLVTFSKSRQYLKLNSFGGIIFK